MQPSQDPHGEHGPVYDEQTQQVLWGGEGNGGEVGDGHDRSGGGWWFGVQFGLFSAQGRIIL